MDVLTPPMVDNPGIEVHIHPFKVISAYERNANRDKKERYLHTSPEFHMKELLSELRQNIFTISYCFRNETKSPHHREQFLMLEWYRVLTQREDYHSIIEDFKDLFLTCYKAFNTHKQSFKTEEYTVSELFKEVLNFEILDFLEKEALYNYIFENIKDVPLPNINQCEWDDLFFLIFLNKIEPILAVKDLVILKEFPAPLSALSNLKKDDQRVCLRFEAYYRGIELCNCFDELSDLDEQKLRAKRQKEDKKRLYNYELPGPEVLFSALENQLPKSAGIALGIERLLMAVTNLENPFYN